jgi:hypothetical protein
MANTELQNLFVSLSGEAVIQRLLIDDKMAEGLYLELRRRRIARSRY